MSAALHSAIDPPANGSSALQLENALLLLQQSGHVWPAGTAPGNEVWLQSVIDGLCELSCHDALTGVANRRQFEVALGSEIDRVARAGEPALVLVVDIDNFKEINDVHGHRCGDLVLRAVAHVLRHCIRPMDTAARIGGDEFAVILPNCSAPFGQSVAERIRLNVQARAVDFESGVKANVTVSIGGAYAPRWVRSAPTVWVDRADRQLYLAKASGRNRACLETVPEGPASAEERDLLRTSQLHKFQ